MDAAAIDTAAAEYDYAHFGLRILDRLPEDGEYLRPSRRWENNKPTDERLEGTSVVGLERGAAHALKLAGAYVGRYVILVGANLQLLGEDDGEALLRGGPGRSEEHTSELQ